jgi:hypothetical protein
VGVELNKKAKGDLAELKVAGDLRARGYRIAFPYTAAMIDRLAVWDCELDRCFYIPGAELGDGMNSLTLRLAPSRNNQSAGVRFAKAYTRI